MAVPCGWAARGRWATSALQENAGTGGETDPCGGLREDSGRRARWRRIPGRTRMAVPRGWAARGQRATSALEETTGTNANGISVRVGCARAAGDERAGSECRDERGDASMWWAARGQRATRSEERRVGEEGR